METLSVSVAQTELPQLGVGEIFYHGSLSPSQTHTMDDLFDSLLEMLLQECTINAREVVRTRNESRAIFITNVKKAAEKAKVRWS